MRFKKSQMSRKLLNYPGCVLEYNFRFGVRILRIYFIHWEQFCGQKSSLKLFFNNTPSHSSSAVSRSSGQCRDVPPVPVLHAERGRPVAASAHVVLPGTQQKLLLPEGASRGLREGPSLGGSQVTNPLQSEQIWQICLMPWTDPTGLHTVTQIQNGKFHLKKTIFLPFFPTSQQLLRFIFSVNATHQTDVPD